MNRKNVIIFLNAFWNNGKGMSGGDQMLIQIFKRVRKNFGKICCVTNFDGKVVIEKDVADVEFDVSPKAFDRLPLIVNYFLRTIRSLKNVFRSDADMIYGGSDFFPDVVPAFIHKLFHPKTKWFGCVFHIYPDWKARPGSKLKSFTAQYLQKISLLMLRKADMIININYQVRDDLVKKGFKKEKIFVNTPGINVEYLRALLVKDGMEKYDATFLARLNPSKGIFDLAKIWKKVVEKNPDARLAIMGGGSDEIKNKLKEEIGKSGLASNIEILGFLENDEAFALIKSSKVFIFPSHEEGFGIAIAEAMACGVPVVSWDLDVYKEIFEDYSIQVEENDVELFSEKVIGILNDEEKRNGIASRASGFVGKYSWDSIAKKHQDILLKQN